MTKSNVSVHLANAGHREINPTKQLLGYWHARLNRELFRGKLGKCRLTYGKTNLIETPVYGFYFEGRIHIDRRVKTKRILINTLAHEMVHQLQDEHGRPTTHGKDFVAWQRKLAKKGVYI